MSGIKPLAMTCCITPTSRETQCHKPHTRQNPTSKEVGFVLYKAPGDDLLLHGLSHTTIGACAFHFRVREGIGWCHTAMITRERGEGRKVRWLEPARTLSFGCLGTGHGSGLPSANQVGRSELFFRSNIDASSRSRPLEVIWSSHTDH